MKLFAFLFVLLFAYPLRVQAQDSSLTAADSVMQARIQKAWSDVRVHFERRREGAAVEADDPQHGYAREFMAYFREHPDQPAGIRAGNTAFMMWGNLGAVEEAHEAIKLVPSDSELWGDIVASVGSAYARSNRWEDYIDLITRLEMDVTHPRGRSEILLTLGEHFSGAEERESAKAYFDEVVRLKAHPFDVQKAEGMLYEMTALDVGQEAPNFVAKSIDGSTVNLVELRGGVVLLEFWATFCGPCLPDIPHLVAMAKRFPAEDFQIIGITQDEDLTALASFLKEKGMNWPQIQQTSTFVDEVLAQDQLLEAYNVYAIPRSFLIDRLGRIAATDLRGEELEKEAARLILLE